MTECSSSPPRPDLPALDPQDRQQLARWVWASLRGSLDGDIAAEIADSGPDLSTPRGVFVTLWLDGDLRGCVGSALPRRPLASAAVEQARAAATRDPRFPAVGPEEVERLQVEISVLGPLLRLRGDAGEIAAAIRIGEHGVFLVDGPNRGLLLPSVATRFQWDAKELLEAVSNKAGLDEDAWERPGAEVWIFRCLCFDAPRPAP